ncbi:MAG: FAD-dependent oxidoreductase [Terracidiphilus sp.]
MSAAFDVVVVGGGPGGIAAAAVAVEAGKRVCLLDNNAALGGQIWRGLRTGTAKEHSHGKQFIAWTERLAASECAVWRGWEVVDAPSPSLLRLEGEEGSRDLKFERLILATGARERFLPFPGWTLPGAMGVGGVQALIEAGLDPAGKRVVVAGSGPLLLTVAAKLAGAGAKVKGIFEQAPALRLCGFGWTALGASSKLIEGAGYLMSTLGVAYRSGWWVKRAEGANRVESVTVTNGRKERTIPCDWLACGFHLVPNLELPRLLGCRIEACTVAVDEWLQSSVARIVCVGELTGVGGMEKALVEGQIAGLAAAGREDRAQRLLRQQRRWKSFAVELDRAFAPRAELSRLPAAETIVCRCEDVMHGELAERRNWREAKLHTRCGMGACQGRICGAAAEFLYGWQMTGARPPAFPAKTGTIGAAVVDAGAPKR